MYTTFLQNQSLDREDNILYIWDAYKSVHGVRPRWLDFNTMTSVEINDFAIQLRADVKESIRHEEAKEQRAKKKFEKAIALCLSSGAKTRKQAIKWLVDAERLSVYDRYISVICEKFGISLKEYYKEFTLIYPKMRVY